MSKPLFVGSYLQVTRWTLGQWKGRKKNASNDNLYYFIISFSKEKNTPKLLHKIGAPCKRKPPHGSLAFEWNFFLTRWLVRFYDQKSAFHADWFSLQFEITKFRLHCLLGEIMVPPCFPLRPRVFHWDPVFSTRPRVFHTPCFPHSGTPYPGTPAPRFPPGLC